MIKKLIIRNYGLFNDLNIEFSDGFSVISGETGSGKSIMLDALSLLLGRRVERFLSTNNNSKTIIEAVFILDSSKKQFFLENNLDFHYETIVRREINQNGKSRAFINDTPVLIQILSFFGKQVIEIYSQHQSILLKDSDIQFKLIDQLSKSFKQLSNYHKELSEYNLLLSSLESFKKFDGISSSELEFLKFQYAELESANLLIDEPDNLESKISILNNIDGIASAIVESEALLNNDTGVLSFLSSLNKKLVEFDTFNELSDRVSSVIIELNDISSELSIMNNKIEADPEQLLFCNNRLDLINSLLKKHRKSHIEELINFKLELKEKINNSASFESKLLEKEDAVLQQKNVLNRAAKVLNEKRKLVVVKFKKDVENHLNSLGMPYAKFEVLFSNIETYNQNGNTEISFLFSANKGKALERVEKVASGGELSRLMLSIKYILAQSSKINILVFDEIDTGISGEIASLMGDMMREISKKSQLITISHLPQISSKANTHLKVVKTIVNNKTISDIIILDREERIEEIAKLLSGRKLTKAAFKNAIDLLSQ